MKKALLLLAALMCALCLFTASAGAAEAAPEDENAAVSAVSDDVEEDGINLTAASTLIISICSVLTAGVVGVAVILARRNQGVPASAEK